MILERGNMWSVFGKTGLFLITTNPIITKAGKLVMGRGIARQMRDNFPGSDVELANLVRAFPSAYVMNMYHEPTFGKQSVGFFMVKHHWNDPAQNPVIMQSTARLMEIAPSWERIDLNFPGIGNGKLKREDVLPIIEQLPDNVHVWEFS
jgi:hypothetical protein